MSQDVVRIREYLLWALIGLKIHTPGTPSAGALAEAARRYPLAVVRLTAKA